MARRLQYWRVTNSFYESINFVCGQHNRRGQICSTWMELYIAYRWWFQYKMADVSHTAHAYIVRHKHKIVELYYNFYRDAKILFSSFFFFPVRWNKTCKASRNLTDYSTISITCLSKKIRCFPNHTSLCGNTGGSAAETCILDRHILHRLPLVGYLNGSFFHLVDAGNVFLRNLGKLPDYTESHPRIQHSK
jgi:hypothetical protein